MRAFLPLARVLTRVVCVGQTRVSRNLKALTVVNQRKWPHMYERLVKEVSLACVSFFVRG